MPGAVVGTQHTAVNETDINPCLPGAQSPSGKRIYKNQLQRFFFSKNGRRNCLNVDSISSQIYLFLGGSSENHSLQVLTGPGMPVTSGVSLNKLLNLTETQFSTSV